MDSETGLPGEPPPDSAAGWPGLDVACGLSQVSNKRPLYRKLLRSYHDSNSATAQKLDDALAAGDRKLLNRLVHTLKGTSGTLGINGVYAAAVSFEQLGGDADPAQLGALLNQLKAEQEKALSSIARYLATD